MPELKEKCVTCDMLASDESGRAVCDAGECVINTVEEADLQRFTEQQIEGYCSEVLIMCGAINDVPVGCANKLARGIKIIRQLQLEVANKQFAADVFEAVLDGKI